VKRNHATRKRLSSRETEVIELLGQGRTPSEIATQLRLSRKTVQTFVYRLKKKLGAANIHQLIRIAVLWRLEH
jgi:DNA-binding CsgD family transcriptional regulator